MIATGCQKTQHMGSAAMGRRASPKTLWVAIDGYHKTVHSPTQCTIVQQVRSSVSLVYDDRAPLCTTCTTILFFSFQDMTKSSGNWQIRYMLDLGPGSDNIT